MSRSRLPGPLFKYLPDYETSCMNNNLEVLKTSPILDLLITEAHPKTSVISIVCSNMQPVMLVSVSICMICSNMHPTYGFHINMYKLLNTHPVMVSISIRRILSNMHPVMASVSRCIIGFNLRFLFRYAPSYSFYFDMHNLF
jgi:hypothetical protein